jgi:cytoplasmic iron level regulating protein YaaA (DUF328/UPF0246 family)
MLITISPSKTLDFSPTDRIKSPTKPDYLDEAATLIARLRKITPKQLAKLMDISDKLAKENHDRYQAWQQSHTPANSKPAVLAYRGDVYDGINADTLKPADFKFAQAHLRILSGLYGVLRPLDLIQPYRLEMGIPLKNDEAADLYGFWRERVTAALNAALKAAKAKVLVNLASNEYWTAVDADRLQADVVNAAFKEERNGKFQFLSFFGKKARGLMAGWIVRERPKAAADLKQFNVERYRFNVDLSSDDEYVFTRKS